MRKLITASFILLLFAVPSISMAQVNEGLGLGPRIGYYEAVDAEEGSFFIGLQLRGHLSEYLGVEAAIEYRTTSEYEFAGGSVKSGLVPITVSGLLYLPLSEHFMPYGVAGLGGYYAFYDTEGLTEAQDDFEGEFIFGYHLGFGVEIPFGESVALNADYRYLFLEPEDGENDFSGHAITAGLMFYL